MRGAILEQEMPVRLTGHIGNGTMLDGLIPMEFLLRARPSSTIEERTCCSIIILSFPTLDGREIRAE